MSATHFDVLCTPRGRPSRAVIRDVSSHDVAHLAENPHEFLVLPFIRRWPAQLEQTKGVSSCLATTQAVELRELGGFSNGRSDVDHIGYRPGGPERLTPDYYALRARTHVLPSQRR